MNMRGDNEVKRRGKSKQFRGKKADMQMNEAYITRNFSWGSGHCPTILTIPEEYSKDVKGQWTYPKKGFIQWKNIT